MNFYKTHKSVLFIYCLFVSPTLCAEINRDLELDALFTKINHTQTIYGGKALQTLLTNPIDDIQTLCSRQSIIAYIAKNENFHAKLNSLLQNINAHEPYFEYIFKDASDIETAALKEFYFSHPYFKQWNYNPAYLELGQVAYLANLCSSLVQHSVTYAIFTLALEEEHTCAVHPPKKHAHKKHSHLEEEHVCAVHSPKKHDHKKHNHKDHKHHDGACTHHSHQTNNALLQNLKAFAKLPNVRYAFQVWHTIAQVQELYSIQAIVRSHCNCITEIQTQLIGIANGLRMVNDLYTTLQDRPEITTHLRYYKDLENTCLSTNISHKLQTLLTLLKTDTFKGKASTFSRIGIILAAYKLIQEIGHELQPALNAVGEIDAYASCTQLFKEHQHGPLFYSFAHYETNSAHPQLNAHEFWHPLATIDSIQLNTMSLGANDKPQHIILTGPNACGKSTSLKALTLCAYLAQTITIVPAQEYSQTIYKEIYSSMVVSDDLINNKSLFVCEITNAEELLEKVDNLKADEYMLITLDELFKSTHHEKGQEIAQRLLKNLYACPQVITLVSTHFEELTVLADQHKDIAINCTLDNFVLTYGIGSFDNSFDIINKQIKSCLII
jgi:ABC-type iron transport system FetAB ATPase subunit